MIQARSVESFQRLNSMYRRDSFVRHHWVCTSICRPYIIRENSYAQQILAVPLLYSILNYIFSFLEQLFLSAGFAYYFFLCKTVNVDQTQIICYTFLL